MIVRDIKKGVLNNATEKTYMEQMIFKYPNMNRVSDCSICGHDLRYDNKIHRIDMAWYCDKCYKKYKVKKWKSK